MRSESETKIERDVADWWEEQKPPPWKDCCHIKIVIWGRAGWPDHIFIGPKGLMWIEFKKPGEDPEPLQAYIHKLLRALGQRVEVHDNKEEACAALASLL